MSDMKAKVALVTGGSRGIGQFIAEGLVKAGVKVYISSRKADVCDATAKALSDFGECVSLPHDLSRMEGVNGLTSRLLEAETKLDILVNNAGATWGAPLDEFPEVGWDRVMDLNLKAVFFLTQKLLPLLRAAATPEDPARVINIGSIAGLHVGQGETLAYAASKAAVHHMTRGFAIRLASEKITVNAIAPGAFDTKMMEYALKDPDARRRIEEEIPLGRVGRPEDIADLALFLSGPGGRYISGAIIPLDGAVSVR